MVDTIGGWTAHGRSIVAQFPGTIQEQKVMAKITCNTLLCLLATSAVGGLIAISLNSIEPYNYYYYNAITVAMVIVFVLSRIQFKWGVISAVIMWLSVNIGLIGFGQAENKLAIVVIY